MGHVHVTIGRHVLDYLRDECIYSVPAPDRLAVLAEADFLELKGLRSKVEALPQVPQKSSDRSKRAVIIEKEPW